MDGSGPGHRSPGIRYHSHPIQGEIRQDNRRGRGDDLEEHAERDEHGDRAEFIGLVERAKEISER